MWHYRPIEAGSTSSYTGLSLLLSSSRNSNTFWSRSTKRGWPQCRRRHFPSTLRVCPFNVLYNSQTHLRSTVNSLAVLWTLASFLCCRYTTETLHCRSFSEELPEDHVAGISVWLGTYVRDKYTCARTYTENVGGGLYARGDVYAGHTGKCNSLPGPLPEFSELPWNMANVYTHTYHVIMYFYQAFPDTNITIWRQKDYS